MLAYPSISRDYVRDTPFYAFDKLDGSNIRVEWSGKRGVYKFGTKTQLIDHTAPIFGEAVVLFNKKYGDDLPSIFEKQRWRNVVMFCEFYGPNSFAGNHNLEEAHDVTLFDVSVNDALLKPREFLDCFEHLDIPKLLYRGNIGEEFIQLVHNSELDGMSGEGVVCKGTWNKKKNRPNMFKIKSNAWIGRLKEYCNGNMDLMARLL